MMRLIKNSLVILYVHFLVQMTNARTFKPANGEELQAALDKVSPGDTIELLPIDYEGDFSVTKSSTTFSPIKLFGAEPEDDIKTTGIVGTVTGLSIKGDYWFIKNLNISAEDEGVVILGNHNHMESIAILDAKTALLVEGTKNTLGSISINDVGEGIIVNGPSNTFRDISWSNSKSGITINSGDNNKLHNLAVNNNIHGGFSLFLAEGTCCGVLTNTVYNGLVEIQGDRYNFRNTVVDSAINIQGCGNVLSRSVFGRAFFTKECENTFRGSNVFHYPQEKATLLKNI